MLSGALAAVGLGRSAEARASTAETWVKPWVPITYDQHGRAKLTVTAGEPLTAGDAITVVEEGGSLVAKRAVSDSEVLGMVVRSTGHRGDPVSAWLLDPKVW